MERYIIVDRPVLPVYAGPQKDTVNDRGQKISNVSDECLYGTICRVLRSEDGWMQILTSHGYCGYISADEISGAECSAPDPFSVPEQEQMRIITGMQVDILTEPCVEGERLITLPAGAVIRDLGPSGEDGWQKVLLADGRTGYTGTNWLGPKRYADDRLYQDPQDLIRMQAGASRNKNTAQGGDESFRFSDVLNKWFDGSESLFRKELVDTARSYLGTQYRWAGRSSRGIDCSGLLQICYLRCGVCIYRDAAIVDGYPLTRLDTNALKPGDALYFPRHVAMYTGDGMYIHSTAKAGSHGVVYNSLQPEHPLYRADLRENLYAAAGLRLS